MLPKPQDKLFQNLKKCKLNSQNRSILVSLTEIINLSGLEMILIWISFHTSTSSRADLEMHGFVNKQVVEEYWWVLLDSMKRRESAANTEGLSYQKITPTPFV